MDLSKAYPTIFLCVFLYCVLLYTGIVSAEQRQPSSKPDQSSSFSNKLEADPPTFANVAYGPHERNVLDFWKVRGEAPTPLLVMIHGGGWVAGDKNGQGLAAPRFVDRGISVAAINYRLTPDNPLPAPVHDAARAIQFLRTKSSEWNIRPDRIALTGGSAGACTSMWLLLHDDLADSDSEDPVLRESTRVCAASVSVGQTSIDPKVIVDWVGPKVLEHRMIYMAVGEHSMENAWKRYTEHEHLYKEFSPYNHLDGKDPPLYMTYAEDTSMPSKNAGHGIHHPNFGVKMKEKGDAVGAECYLNIKGLPAPEKYSSGDDFLYDMLLRP